MVKETLIWRKKKRIPHIMGSSVPREIYDLGAIVSHKSDSDGNGVLYLRSKYLFFTDETRECLYRLIAATVFALIEKGLVDNKGWVLFNDFTDISLSHFNPMEITNFILIYQKYIPGRVSKIILYNVPWYAKYIIKTIIMLLPSELRKITFSISKNQVEKLIPLENLPLFITNPSIQFKPPFNPEVKDIDHCDHELLGIKPEHINAFKAIYAL
ncbi:Motile sperm domain-containing protein 2-like protein [Dinothrombium tinctorium]|uniref:Motile sperm domain-containing protein 2-like protein n=1 Tax=Dinothrombium tinctorium TaxID=1965070 RepID=A0A3S3NYP4_9ACAR|nr:Motile sperm domain-containing protein 2-like protein [Dinothrombium tinctorium]